MDCTKFLENAVLHASQYPGNNCGIDVHDHTLRAIRSQLDRRATDLFGSSPSVDLLELWNSDQEYHETSLKDSTITKAHLMRSIMAHRQDPLQRLLFIGAPHSRAPLDISQQMLLEILTYQQVLPAFLEFVFPFGNQHYVQDLYFGGFRSEVYLESPRAGLECPALGRSGKHIDLCYNLKSIEATKDERQPWSIRQCSIHHRFDFASRQSTWIVLKANKVLRKAFQRELQKLKNMNSSSTGRQAMPGCDSLAATIKLHQIVTLWASENWHWYIRDLETLLQEKSRRLLTISLEEAKSSNSGFIPSPPGKGPPKRSTTLQSLGRPFRRVTSFNTSRDDSTLVASDASFVLEPIPFETPSLPVVAAIDSFSFVDLQRLQKIEEQVNEALLVLKNNTRVIGELSKAYGSLLSARGAAMPAVHESTSAIEEFQRQLAGIVQDLIMHQSRLEALLRMCADRKSLLQGALQFRSMQLSRELAERTHHSTINMEDVTVQMHQIARKTLVETVSMRIITVVTLLFLPGTFISTLMSTPIVNFPDGATSFSEHNIGSGALKLYLLVSLPLMCLTLVAWAVMYLREKNRTKEDTHDIRMMEAGVVSLPTTSTAKSN